MVPAGARLIETMRVDASRRIPLWEGHARRLAGSCEALGYRQPADPAAAVDAAVRALPGDGREYRLRLLVDAGGKLALESAVLPPLAPGQRVALASERLDAGERLLRHKTTHRPWFGQATAWLAGHPAYFDLLFLNTRGELCEGSRSNVYLNLDGRWLTPPVACGLLPGVQRDALLRAGRVREAVLGETDLRAASAVRLSNGLRGWFDAGLDPLPPGD